MGDAVGHGRVSRSAQQGGAERDIGRAHQSGAGARGVVRAAFCAGAIQSTTQRGLGVAHAGTLPFARGASLAVALQLGAPV